MKTLKRDIGFLVLAMGCVWLYAAQTGGGFPLDDSWIHQVYARNLAQLGEWSFVAGVPSAASTSPLYTVLLSIGYRVGIAGELWAHVLGGVALAALGILSARLVDLLPQPTLAKFSGWCGVAVILAWQLIWAAGSGMETPIFAALTLAVLWAAWRETVATSSAGWRGAIFGGLSALCVLARPEGVLLVALAGLAVVVWQLSGDAGRRGLVAWLLGAAVGFGVLLSPYLLLNLQLTGGVLPNTAAAKWMQHAPLLAQNYLVRVWQMTLPLWVGGQALLVPGVLAYAVYCVRRSPMRGWLMWLLPVLWVVGLVALYAARLPANYQHGRYVMPALPALIIAGVIGTGVLLQKTRNHLLLRVVMRALALSAVLVWAFFAVGLGRSTYARDVQIINEEMVASAHWIREHLPPDALLAIHDIGAVGYFAPRPLVDIAGLLSPEVVPLINDPAGLWALMQAMGAQYLMAFPDQVPGGAVDDPRLCRVFVTDGEAARAAGGANMAIYRLAWAEPCETP